MNPHHWLSEEKVWRSISISQTKLPKKKKIILTLIHKHRYAWTFSMEKQEQKTLWQKYSHSSETASLQSPPETQHLCQLDCVSMATDSRIGKTRRNQSFHDKSHTGPDTWWDKCFHNYIQEEMNKTGKDYRFLKLEGEKTFQGNSEFLQCMCGGNTPSPLNESRTVGPNLFTI